MRVWQPMAAEDLAEVQALADVVHPDLPEDQDVLEQRLATFPKGCLVLKVDGAIEGYAFSHPIPANAPPALNTAPKALGPEADVFYIHDFVVAPSQRGTGMAAKGIETLLGLAKGYRGAALISVYGTAPFWQKFGFHPANDLSQDKLASYGEGSVYMRRR